MNSSTLKWLWLSSGFKDPLILGAHLHQTSQSYVDAVYVKAKYFHTTCLSKQLSDKNPGPFKIIPCPGTHPFTLQLPDSMKSIHPVFYVSQLETLTLNTILPSLIEIDREVKYEIVQILNSKFDC